jgi:ABC-type multidrug transport system permease subunit
MRERANGFYSAATYYASKVMFDVVPLRMIPPLLFGSIIYFLVGFNPQVAVFLKFLLALILFNLTCSSICLTIAVAFQNHGVANLVASLTILFSMLFGGFLLNKEKIPLVLAWLKYLSSFYYAYEALIVNELQNVRLHDSAIVDIDVRQIADCRSRGR